MFCGVWLLKSEVTLNSWQRLVCPINPLSDSHSMQSNNYNDGFIQTSCNTNYIYHACNISKVASWT